MCYKCLKTIQKTSVVIKYFKKDFFLFLQTQDKRVYLYDNEWILIERSLKNTQRVETTGAGRE